MNYRDITVKRAMDRVDSFLKLHKSALGELNSAKARIDFDNALADFAVQAAQQKAADTQSSSMTEVKNELRADLRINHMQPIAAIAKTAPTSEGDKSIEKLRFPAFRLNDRSLIAAAIAMADIAADRREMFLAHKLPADFVEQLRSATAAFGKALDERDGFRLARVTATNGMQAAARRGGRQITLLNSLVIRQLGRKSSLIQTWKMAMRHTQKPGGPGQPTDSVEGAEGGAPAPPVTPS